MSDLHIKLLIIVFTVIITLGIKDIWTFSKRFINKKGNKNSFRRNISDIIERLPILYNECEKSLDALDKNIIDIPEKEYIILDVIDTIYIDGFKKIEFDCVSIFSGRNKKNKLKKVYYSLNKLKDKVILYNNIYNTFYDNYTHSFNNLRKEEIKFTSHFKNLINFIANKYDLLYKSNIDDTIINLSNIDNSFYRYIIEIHYDKELSSYEKICKLTDNYKLNKYELFKIRTDIISGDNTIEEFESMIVTLKHEYDIFNKISKNFKDDITIMEKYLKLVEEKYKEIYSIL